MNDSIVEKVWWVNQTQSSESISNLTVGEPFVFDCDVGNELPTEIHWYKNNKEIKHKGHKNSLGVKLLGKGTLLYIPRAKVENNGKYLCIAMNILGEVHTERILNVKESFG